jgi:hypothetical protein
MLVLGLAIAGCGGGDDALPADATDYDPDVPVLTDEEATEAAAEITDENVEDAMRRLEAGLEADPESGG